MKKLLFIINGNNEVIVIKSKGLLRKIMNEKLYKVEWGFLQLRDIDYKII
jgi:hypothetical protein